MKEEALYPPTHLQCCQIPYFSKAKLMTWSGNVQKHALYQVKSFLHSVLFNLSAMESAVEAMQGDAIVGGHRAKKISFPHTVEPVNVYESY